MCQDCLIIVIVEGLMCWRLGRWIGDGMASILALSLKRARSEELKEEEKDYF